MYPVSHFIMLHEANLFLQFNDPSLFSRMYITRKIIAYLRIYSKIPRSFFRTSSSIRGLDLDLMTNCTKEDLSFMLGNWNDNICDE